MFCFFVDFQMFSFISINKYLIFELELYDVKNERKSIFMKLIKFIILVTLTTILLSACGDNFNNNADTNSSFMVTENNRGEKKIVGKFSGKNNHSVMGSFKIQNNKLMLRDFSTDKGPELYVYLSKGDNINKSKRLAKINLENENQDFSLFGIDFEEYNTVLIYYDKAHELFGSAKYKVVI